MMQSCLRVGSDGESDWSGWVWLRIILDVWTRAMIDGAFRLHRRCSALFKNSNVIVYLSLSTERDFGMSIFQFSVNTSSILLELFEEEGQQSQKYTIDTI